MNIVYFGSAKIGVPSLKALISSGQQVSCVVTQPDKRRGRHLHLEGTAIKEVAAASNLKIFQPENINSPESLEFLNGFGADLFVVIAYGQLLSQEVIDIPKFFCINAHTSLLPQYRGAAPINWSIIRGEEETGVSVMKMEKKMDAGPVILQKKIRISPEDTAVTLELKLAEVAKDALLESLRLIEGRSYKLLPQAKEGVSFAPKLKKDDGAIDWALPAGEIYNLIRGVISWPGAFTHYKGKLIKIYNASLSSPDTAQRNSRPGEIIEVAPGGLLIACGKGAILVNKVQLEGGRVMSVHEFVAGHKIMPGDILKK